MEKNEKDHYPVILKMIISKEGIITLEDIRNISGFVDYYEKVYTNWISPEEKQRIADEKKRQEYQKELQRKAKEYEQKRLAEANKNNTQSILILQIVKSKTNTIKQRWSSYERIFRRINRYGNRFGLYSIMDRNIKKINDKYFLGAAFLLDGCFRNLFK